MTLANGKNAQGRDELVRIGRRVAPGPTFSDCNRTKTAK